MCTLEKRGNIYILTLTGSGEHRLNSVLLDSIQSILRKLRSEPVSPSSALITTADGKFFSNGYDLNWAKSASSTTEVDSRLLLMDSKLRSVVADLISLPMPTIAAVTGHASAAGFVLALSHDYVMMRKDRGFLYMSEVDIGMVIPAWFVALLKCKVGSARVTQDVVLKATKFTAEMAVKGGIVQSAHDSAEETLKAAVEMGEELVKRGWDGHVYAQNRMVLMREALNSIEAAERQNGNAVKSKL